jgi:hypothetical protein
MSSDGSRVVFVAGGGSNTLYLRDLPRGETLELDAPEPGCTTCQAGGGVFQYASTDDSRIFFSDARSLTADSAAEIEKPDLYMCEVRLEGEHLACALSDLTANPMNPAQPGGFQGTLIGGSDDASSVYFVANGTLTQNVSSRGEHAVSGSCATAGLQSGSGFENKSCNLYRLDTQTGDLTLIAVLSLADLHSWAGGGADLGEMTSRVSPDGRYLAFMSSRPLTGYDNRDAISGARDEEVFLYDSQADRLLCASCNPTGARPHGIHDPGLYPGLLVDSPSLWGSAGAPDREQTLAADLPGGARSEQVFAQYLSRNLSDSGRLFFNAADSLVPQDTNGTFDVYEFEFPQGPGQPASNTCTTASSSYSPVSGGCVSLISSGTSPEESAFMDASESGDDVFFLTASHLTGRDDDTSLDLYDARVGGGEPTEVKPVECSGDACQQPAVPPNDATPGSLTFNGAGNLLQCPKGKVKQKGKCVKKKQSKKKNKGRKHKKNAHRKPDNKKGKKQRRANSKHGGHK